MKQAGPGGGRTTRNILALSRASSGAREQVTFEESLAAVLEPVLADLGSMDARRDARAATSAVIGVLQDLLWNEQPPTAADTDHLARSEERRVGKECVSTCRYRVKQYH